MVPKDAQPGDGKPMSMPRDSTAPRFERQGLEQLRMATALAHTIAGAELVLTTAAGTRLVVGGHPAADLHACELRRAVLASACPARPDLGRWIVGIDIGGSLADQGAGVYRVRPGAAPEWTFATVLSASAVAATLGERPTGVDPSGADDVRVTARPDRCLGVTVVSLAAVSTRLRPRQVCEIAMGAHAALLVHELENELGRVRTGGDGHPASPGHR